MMVKLLLVRHGHSRGSSPRAFGAAPTLRSRRRVTQQAREVAHSIAARWRPVCVYSSPLQRCRDTAREIASACGVKTAVLDGLNDLDYGAWQWLTHADVHTRSPALYDRWFESPHLVRFPEGE